MNLSKIGIGVDNQILVVTINSVKEWKSNPRKNDSAVPKLAEMIRIRGQVTPIVVWRKNNTIYKGNTTWKACKLLGFKTVKVLYAEFPNELAAQAYGIADNKSSEWSEWDDSVLNKFMQSEEFDFTATGFAFNKDNNVKYSDVELISTEKPNTKKEESVSIVNNDLNAVTMSGDYETFLKSKLPIIFPKGFDVPDIMINKKLFSFQRDIVKWAVRRGRACVFSGTGTGKTLIQLEWARLVAKYTNGKVLILCPLAVAEQTIAIAEGMHIQIEMYKNTNSGCSILITNYEQLHNIDTSKFVGVVLDESSIIKNYEGSVKQMIFESFYKTDYKLCCTATPAPNDYMEIGTHSEFTGIMRREEMLSMFFVHDSGRVSDWRLKGHAKEDFWMWMASWCVMFNHPKDLGYTDEYITFFDLPNLKYHCVFIKSGIEKNEGGIRQRALNRKGTIQERVQESVRIANKIDGPCVLWCDYNDEGDTLEQLINGVQIKGSDPVELKKKNLIDFAKGKIQRLITKPSMMAFGLNWQHCNNTIFVGLSDSFEQYYQAIRRFWRAGQKKEVNVYIVLDESQKNVYNNIKRKEYEFANANESMIEFMKDTIKYNLSHQVMFKQDYKTAKVVTASYALYMGDCIDIMKTIKSNSIQYSIFSPPFASLFTYSNSARDIGNCTNFNQFLNHFKYAIKELYRVMCPGRDISFHVQNLSTSKQMHGFIGLVDLRGLLIKAFQDEGFIYHSEVTIWKNPVTEMQRTKALGLLHKQLKKDAAMCRQGKADYLVTMRKPGDNKRRIVNTNTTFPVSEWQEYASPVWMDIKQSNTLQKTSAREYEDERHICPLQLDIIERALRLWTTRGDTILSPFAGIGSEGYVTLKMGDDRKFVGIELKEAYFKQMELNLKTLSGEKDAGN